MLLRGATLVTPNGSRALDVRVVGERVADVAPAGTLPREPETHDLDGLWLLPGLVDVHVHFREPGGHAPKGGYASESRAAAAGGVTCVLTMPNTVPPTADDATLEAARECARRSLVDFGFHLFVAADNREFLRRNADVAGYKLYLNETTGVASPLCDEGVVGSVLALGHPTVAHAESDTLEWLLALHARLGTGPLHIAHVALAGEVAAIRAAKTRGQPVTAEVTPHHLFLTEADHRRLGPVADMRPTLKSADDQAALWAGLADGTIDAVATDHAPHTWAEKTADRPPPGVIGLQSMLPLLLTAVAEGRLSAPSLVRLTSSNPARIFGLVGKGGVRVGGDADLVVVDPTAAGVITNEEQISRAAFTPFAGRRVIGRVVRTLRRGTWLWSDGAIVAEGGGREARSLTR